MAPGDFDGDGLCDLAVSSVIWSRANQGDVFLYRGRAPLDLSPGGLGSEPSLWLQPDIEVNNRSEFGRRIDMGDVNGDGLDDLLVGHNAADIAGQNSGAAHLFLGGALPDVSPTVPTLSSEADWTATGVNWDHFGGEIKIVDYDGVGPLDLLIGALYDDIEGAWDVGQIHVFAGVDGGLPAAEPLAQIPGPESGFRLGLSALPVGDSNGDGVVDFIAQSHYGGTEFPQVGRPFHIVSGAEGVRELRPLDLELRPAGTRFGHGVALVGDIDGDGFEDAFVAAMQAAHPDIGIRSGELWFYPGTPDGLSVEGQRVPPFLNHTPWDFLRGVRHIGDFDGDGHGDMAVLVSHDELPNNMPDAMHHPEGCTARMNDQGAVYIFRGGPGIFDLSPDLVYWGQAVGDIPEFFVGGGDYNGDGLADIVVGSIRRDRPERNDAGAVTIIAGQADTHPDKLTSICQPFYEHVAGPETAHFGYTATFVNDLNQDGCDEIAVGARLDARDGLPNQGGVHLIYGHGGPGCFPDARFVIFNPGVAYWQAGTSVAAGDLNNDGIDELAIGAAYARHDNETRGGVWVLPSDFVTSIMPRPWADASLMPGHWVDASLGNRFLPGLTQSGEAGRGLFIAQGVVGVGEINGFVSGEVSVASLRLYGLLPNGELDMEPRALIIGETQRPGSRLSELMGTGVSPDGRSLILGASRGGGTNRDGGSAYVLDLSLINQPD